MWYYEFDGKPFGPIKLAAVAEAIRSGRINADTLISKKGTTEWIRLGDSELAVLTNIDMPAPTADQKLIPPREGSHQNFSRINLKNLAATFWWWVGGTGFSILGNVLLFATGAFSYITGAVIFVNIPWMAASVLEFVLTYQFWNIIQDGSARTTPVKAVGFQFIPFYAIYWLFPAYIGLSKDQNSFIDRHFGIPVTDGVRKTNPFVSWIYVLLYWLWFVVMVLLIISTIIYENSYYGFNWWFTFYNDGIIIPVMILLGLSIFARIGMMVDFYLTTRSIGQKMEGV